MKKKYSQWLFVGSILLNLCFLFIGARHYIILKKQNAEDNPNAWPDTWNKQRCAVYEGLEIKKGDIVFVGDSETDCFPLQEYFPNNASIKNRGIGLNQTRHILGRITAIAAAHPSKIFLQAGLNDLNQNVKIPEIIANYFKIVKTIRTVSPTTKIYLQSVTPTRDDWARLDSSIVELNKALRIFCSEQGISYIDIHSGLIKDGQLDSSFTIDGIHLTGRGYAVWKKQIDTLISD